MISFIYSKSKEGYCFAREKIPSFSFLLSFSIAAKFHDLTAKESAFTNASLQDPLMTSDGRFVINDKYSSDFDTGNENANSITRSPTGVNFRRLLKYVPFYPVFKCILF